MKSNEERTRYILETSEKRLNEKRVKRKKAEKIAAGAFCTCAVLAFSVGFYNSKLLPFPDDVIESQTTTAKTDSPEITTVHMTERSSATIERITVQTTEKISGTSSVTSLTNTEEVFTESVKQTETTPVIIYTTTTDEVSVAVTTSAEIPDEQTTTDDITEQPSYEQPLPWEEMPINQKYFMCDFDGKEYQTEKQEVSAENVGESIGTGFMSGWDGLTDTYYHCDAEIFSVAEKDSENYIAIRFSGDDRFYIYKNCAPSADDSITDITD